MGGKFLQKLRLSRKKRGKDDSVSPPEEINSSKAEVSHATAPLSPATDSTFSDYDDIDYGASISKNGTPVISSLTMDHFRPSDVYDSPSKAGSHISDEMPMKISLDSKMNRKSRKMVPTAKESAFSGPPRYDWIDIETAAAVRIQTIYRRNKAMSQLNEEGKTTAAMRNRVRSLRTRNRRTMASEDVPSIFRFCGIGFLFGDATGEDQAVLNAHEKIQYEEKKRTKQAIEAQKRKFRMRKKASDNYLEAVEVVDDVKF